MKSIKIQNYTGDWNALISAPIDSNGSRDSRIAHYAQQIYLQSNGEQDLVVDGIGVGSMGDMILVYEIPTENTPIELAIQAKSTWFSAGQAVVINWGDGSAAETVSAASGHTGYVGHTYTAVGTYTVKISGSMMMYGRGGDVDILGQEFLTHIHSFGKLGLTSFSRAFRGCTGLTSVPKTLPDSVTNMYVMFSRCSNVVFNPDVSNWNVSKVTNMAEMFRYCSGAAFNPDMKSWTLKNSVATVNIFNCSKTQPRTWLDELLVAWAANHLQGSNITIDFSPNKFTVDGGEPLQAVADALAILEGRGWTITTANPYTTP